MADRIKEEVVEVQKTLELTEKEYHEAILEFVKNKFNIDLLGRLHSSYDSKVYIAYHPSQGSYHNNDHEDAFVRICWNEHK
jgi:DNA-binding FadR family transcriptional regulator